MIRLTELKLALDQVPAEVRRAADAPTETEADRAPPPHPEAALRQLAAEALGIAPAAIAHLQVFKRSFDARKAELRAVYIVDLALADPAAEAALLARHAAHPHIGPTPDMAWRAPARAPEGAPRPRVEVRGPGGDQFGFAVGFEVKDSGVRLLQTTKQGDQTVFTYEVNKLNHQ